MDNKTTLIDDISILAAPYLERKKPLSALNLKEPIDQGIARYCLDRRPGFVADLDENDPSHIALLKSWVAKDYSNYISIVNNGFNNGELLAIYLFLKFKAAKSSQYTILRSYGKQTMVSYRYETKKGETIAYFDKTLGVPSVLKVAADVKVKIVSPEQLLREVDIDVALVDLQIVMDHVDRVFNDVLRDSILDYIVKNNLSYYQLSQHYTALSQVAKNAANAILAICGVEVTVVDIIDIAIPNNTNDMFERQFFAIAEAKRVKDFENKQEQASLELYEKKAAIHQKYADFPVTLTEAEKDFALNRYLQRTGVDTQLRANIRKESLAEKELQGEGTVTTGKLVEPKAPKPPKQSKVRKAYIITWILLIAASSLCFLEGLGAALIAYGVSLLILGLFTAIKLDALRKKADGKGDAEYAKQYEVYKREYANYMAAKSENEIMEE